MSDPEVIGTAAGTDTSGTDSSSGFDMDKAVDDIGSSLGFNGSDDTAKADQDDAGKNDDTTNATATLDDTAGTATSTGTDKPASDPSKVAAATPRPAPKSWAKEKHELWSKLPLDAQEYYETREKQMLDGLEQYKEHSAFGKQMREVIAPYKAFITAQGADEPKAVQFLLNAHYRLSTANPQERAQYFTHLAKSYGIDLAGLKPEDAAAVADPHVKALQDQVNNLATSLTAREQQTLNEARGKVQKDVEAFASDPKHQYFDECSEDIVALIQAGHTLEAAYEKAVYANPVTRAKELARLQADSEKALREKSKTEAEAARKAAGTNVRSRDTRRAPTEPKGSMEDTMRATLKEIRGRTTH